MKLNRRQVMASSLAGLGLGSLTPLRAMAFSRQRLAPDMQKLYLEACDSSYDTYHTQLVAEVTRMMEEARLETTRENLKAVLSSLSCPRCGCRLDATDS